MPGLVPGIHVFTTGGEKEVDGRDEPGHDGKHRVAARLKSGSPFSPIASLSLTIIPA